MTALNKQALRGQSVEGSYYLVECCNCGEMYPSNLLDGGEAIADSGDYGDCYCHLCGADDTERADWGDVNSNEAKAWNFQQKRIEALLDELEAEKNMREAAEKRIAEHNFENRLLANADRDIKALRQRIDELSASHSKLRDTMAAIYNAICENGASTSLSTILTFVKRSREESSTAAGIGVKGE